MRKQFFFTGLFVTSLSLFNLSCHKDVIQKTEQVEISAVANNGNSGNEKKIYVLDISQLYTAVNNPGNAGAIIFMSPGTYLLSASYPNSGRVELQTDMELRGQPGHAEAVIIDQTALPTASFNLTGGGRTGGIRMGRGTNTLEWITVRGNVNALSAIDADLLSTETFVRIKHTVVSGSQIGIDLRNRLAEHSGRIIHAEIVNNEMLENQAGFGTGLVIQNANGANGAVINVSMKENYIHANRVGFRAFSNAATSTVNNGTVNVISHADRIEGNGMGMYINGGLTQVASAFANGNETYLEFYGAKIRNNNPTPMPAEIKPLETVIPIGGIFAVGGNSTGGDNKASNNKLVAKFWGTDLSDNGTDMYVFGAWSRPPATIPGINNLAEIYLYGISANANVIATNCVPIDPAGTNLVSIFH
jgi:hypothetical protein